jgi:hypothetical protein
VQLIPTENLGGNCCGRLLPGKRIGPSGTATIRFAWPATYVRTGGVGLTSNVDWGDGQSVTIDVYEQTALNRSARTRTRDRTPRPARPTPPLRPAPGPRASPPSAPALPPFEPGLGVTWEPPPFSSTLLDLKGGSRVPFDLVVNGSVSGSGRVQITSTPSFDGSPAKVSSVSGSGGSLSFSLLNGAWTPASGVTGPTTSAQLALSWPAFADGALTLPLLTASAQIGVNQPLAKLDLSANLTGQLASSLRQIATWVLSRVYLPIPYQAAAVALFIRDALSAFSTGYGFVISLQQLRDQALELLAKAIPGAQQAGILLNQIADIVGVAADQVNIIRDRLRATGRRVLGFLVARASAAQASAATKTPRSAKTPLGLRSRARVRAATTTALRRTRAYRLTRAGARQFAKALVRPATRVRVGPLLVDKLTVRRGHDVTIAAAGLASKQVAVTIPGPGYAAEAPLKTRRGTAAARLRVPLRRGRYQLGIVDLAAPRSGRLRAAQITVR